MAGTDLEQHEHGPALSEIGAQAWSRYAERMAARADAPWWTAVIVTAGSAKQAEQYDAEIAWRRERGMVPAGVLYLTVPDMDNRRMGSGGATLNALRGLAQAALQDTAESLEAWWQAQRVLIIHSGGDSRRLPQYSLTGKLFSLLPVKTPWGDASTVFDEQLALSTLWAERLPAGLVVASGDVILTFEASALRWDRAGVCGVALRQPIEVGSHHGVYVIGEEGRVYAFLQKPSAAEARAAGGLLPGHQVALDTGLLRLCPALAAALTDLAGVCREGGRWVIGEGILGPTGGARPIIDLYEHITQALTGQWRPGPGDGPALRALARVLRGRPFWCDLLEGDFTHVGTTTLFRRLMTEETDFLQLYQAQQRLGAVAPPGVRSAGVIVDSVLSGTGELGPGALVIECELHVPVRAGRGAILHGLTEISDPLEVPDDTVAHQAPVALPDGRRGTVIRVYGVMDDPKTPAGGATWFGRPMMEVIAALGLDPEAVWPDAAADARTLWNARLFPLGTAEESWRCAAWMMGVGQDFSAAEWTALERLSLETSAQSADSRALAEARARRMGARWQLSAVSLAQAGGDIRPLLAQPPGIPALVAAGRALVASAEALASAVPTGAASQLCQASCFLGQAGLADEAARVRAQAFDRVRRAVEQGISDEPFLPGARAWQHGRVTVSAPARADLGGGWSDTPPFCLDWGGTVLNAAISLHGAYPIATTIRRLEEPVLRCLSRDTGGAAQYRTAEELLAPSAPGDPFSIVRAGLGTMGIPCPGESLADTLAGFGGGAEIATEVNLPLGSGLGASSILAATVLRALAAMVGAPMPDALLIDHVLRLEQVMGTGGGWQDQVGGIVPGAKLTISGPGLRQRLRVEPAGWSPERQAEFCSRFLVCYTGMRRVARDLLAQVVGSYLAREAATVQVLHSIKTLAQEMAYAMREGEWGHLGALMGRHWELNQVLDPHTTNAPINAMLQEMAPCLAGAKLAGAGGGGFLLLLARSPEAAQAMRARLTAGDLPGQLFDYAIAEDGLRVEVA